MQDITIFTISRFQLTTSHGGRLERRKRAAKTIRFQLTTSHGGRQKPGVRVMLSKRPFQLTTSHGGRLYLQRDLVPVSSISTHDLTRRSTTFPQQDYAILLLFQLTTSHGGRQFQTAILKKRIGFQLTTSHGGRPKRVGMGGGIANFNSRPHTEVDVSYGYNFYQ